MYKDKDKQREANKKAAKEYRDNRRKAINGMTPKSMTEVNEHTGVIPSNVIPKPERTALGNIRVSKPGDDDYVPQCETTRAFVDNRDKQPSTAKRGKDIKTFADLPPDVQATISRISESNEEKQKRTKAAIKYQHLFPNRFYGVGPWACADVRDLKPQENKDKV